MAQYQYGYRPHDLPDSYNVANTTSQAVLNTSGKRRMRRFDTNAVIAMVGSICVSPSSASYSSATRIIVSGVAPSSQVG